MSQQNNNERDGNITTVFPKCIKNKNALRNPKLYIKIIFYFGINKKKLCLLFLLTARIIYTYVITKKKQQNNKTIFPA